MDDVATRPPTSLHDTDFYTWTQAQARLIRAGCLSETDWPSIAEEIEALGRAEYSALRSSYRLVLIHLLKMMVQPSHRTASWSATIVRERNAIEDRLHDNPGLKPRRSEAFVQAYAGARREAASDTGLALALFPAACPYTLEEVEDHDVWPASASAPHKER